MADDLSTARETLEAALEDTVNRLDEATDPKDIAALKKAQGDLRDQIDLLNEQGLLAAAGVVAAATLTLQNILDNTPKGLDLSFVTKTKKHLDQLGASHAQVHASVAPTSAQHPSSLAPAGATPVNHSTRFADLAAEYSSIFSSCTISPDKTTLVQQSLSVLRNNKARYSSVAANFNNMSWYFVGIIHGMEGSFNFNTHLHNGDPLTQRTTHDPSGRPPMGTPPFTWETSARDALAFENFDRESDFTLTRILYLFEHYNGMAYRQFGLASPYLWSFSNHYVKGKFGLDGKFDPELVSKQVGAAVLLKALREAGEAIG